MYKASGPVNRPPGRVPETRRANRGFRHGNDERRSRAASRRCRLACPRLPLRSQKPRSGAGGVCRGAHPGCYVRGSRPGFSGAGDRGNRPPSVAGSRGSGRDLRSARYRRDDTSCRLRRRRRRIGRPYVVAPALAGPRTRGAPGRRIAGLAERGQAGRKRPGGGRSPAFRTGAIGNKGRDHGPSRRGVERCRDTAVAGCARRRAVSWRSRTDRPRGRTHTGRSESAVFGFTGPKPAVSKRCRDSSSLGGGSAACRR